jgi:hypothetical protein
MPDGTVSPIVPIPTNTRAACADVMEKVCLHGWMKGGGGGSRARHAESTVGGWGWG